MDLKMFLPLSKVYDYLNKISAIIEIEFYSNSINSFFGYGKFKNRSIFFKLIDKQNYNKSMSVYIKYGDKLNLCKIVEHMKISEKYYLVVYEDYKIRYKGIFNGIEFLNNTSINSTIKVATFKRFYNNLFYLTKNSLKYEAITKYPNKVFFEDRFGTKRLYKYYGLSYATLLYDVKVLLGDDNFILIKKLLSLSKTIICKKEKTFTNMSHGDLHDLNYCFYPIKNNIYDILFIDIDTIGINPFLSDFVCYYWYLIYQGDHIIYKYNKEFFGKQSHIEKGKRNEQINIYLEHYFYPIINIIGCKFAWRDEFLRRFIMRILGVYNILYFDIIDRKKIYFILINLLNWYENDKSSNRLPFNSAI
ncbi:MAG: hypothetical protein WC872_03165 [Candidatus Absconditabacterales bacterium]